MAPIISFINSCCNFNLDFLCLVGIGANFGASTCVENLSKFFIVNNLLLKLRTLSLVLKNNPKLFSKTFFNCSIHLSKFSNLVAKLLCSLSASANDKYPSFISLKK